MAEQFILPNATSKMIKPFLQALKCGVTDLAHTHVGWNPASRTAYDGMMGLNNTAAIVNRAGLPPHFYIEIAAGQDNTTLANAVWGNSGDFARALSRGVVPVVLKNLSTTAADYWGQGRKHDALIEEAKKGNVSISIYHLDGNEVGAAEQTTVKGFL